MSKSEEERERNKRLQALFAENKRQRDLAKALRAKERAEAREALAKAREAERAAAREAFYGPARPKIRHKEAPVTVPSRRWERYWERKASREAYYAPARAARAAKVAETAARRARRLAYATVARRYGITPDAIDAVVLASEGRCTCCGLPEDGPSRSLIWRQLPGGPLELRCVACYVSAQP